MMDTFRKREIEAAAEFFTIRFSSSITNGILQLD